MLRKVGTQVVKWTTEGAVKEDTWNYEISSILRREGIRQLPGICWYPVRAQEIVKQGGTAGEYSDPSLTDMEILSWTGFLCTRKLLRNVPVTPKNALRGCTLRRIR